MCTNPSSIIHHSQLDDVSRSLFNLIKRHRAGESIDRSPFKDSVAVYAAMGMGKLDVYENDFEVPVLEDTKKYVVE